MLSLELNIRHPKELLGRHGLAAKKSFGQNFLVDEHHIEAIASQVSSFGEFGIVEIGSGLGALTSRLLKKGRLVHAVERDRDMARIFREEFKEHLENKLVYLHEDNATTFDYLSLSQNGKFHPFVLCGNLPYHLTSTLVFKAIELADHLAGAVFMIQKEVAERIVAPAGSRDYGVLSVLVQAVFHVSITQQVPSGAFWPRPKVDSSVIALSPIVPRLLSTNEFDDLKLVVKTAFSKRRKTLRNCLKDLMPIEVVCARAEIALEARPETLTLHDFLKLVRIYNEIKNA